MIEALESRIAPAGLLKVTFNHGNVTIVSAPTTGQDGNETLTVTQNNPGELTLDPGADVQLQINGTLYALDETRTLGGVTGSVSIKLGAGNDALTFSHVDLPGTLLVDLGTGANSVNITASGAAGAATVKAGAGADALTFGAGPSRFGTNLTIQLGADVGTVSGNVATSLIVGKNFKLLGGTADDDLQFRAGAFSIGGNATFDGKSGSDKVGFATSGAVLVGGNFTATTKGLRTGLGARATLSSTTDSVQVDGNVKLSISQGPSTLLVNGATTAMLGGKVAFVNGPGAMGNATLSSPTLTVVGKITATSRAASGFFNPFGDTLNLTSGITATGYASVGFNSFTSGHIGGPVVFTSAAKTAAYNVSFGLSGVTFDKALTIQSLDTTGGVASVTLGNCTYAGPVKITMGAANGTLYTNGGQYQGGVAMNLGAGHDEVHLSDLAGTNNPGTFNGVVLLKGGAGDDKFILGGNTTAKAVAFLAAVTLDGGTGSNTATIGTKTTFAVPLVKINVV